jgi:hypothetical protein
VTGMDTISGIYHHLARLHHFQLFVLVIACLIQAAITWWKECNTG